MKYLSLAFSVQPPGGGPRALPLASLILEGVIYTHFMHRKTEAQFLESLHQGPQSGQCSDLLISACPGPLPLTHPNGKCDFAS